MTSDPREPAPAPRGDSVDLVIVGGGPAGLAAAATVLIGGLRVALLDAGLALGGQFWRHPPVGSRVLGTERFHHGLSTRDALVATLHRFAASGRLDLRLAHHAWTVAAANTGFTVHATDRSGSPGGERSVAVHGRRLLVATGAFDRQLPFPGWDLPGVFTAGGMQALLKGGGVTAGRRVVIGGTGPFLLPVATGVARAGAEVVALCEANDPRRWLVHLPAAARLPSKGWEGVGYAASLLRHGVPLRVRSAIVSARGSGRVEEVTVARLTSEGAVLAEGRKVFAVDAVGVGWGFTPQLDLAVTLGARLTGSPDGNSVVVADEWQRSSIPGLLVAGEVCGIGGAELALREGQLAAEGVLRDLDRPGVLGEDAVGRVRRIVAAHRAFARAMQLAHPVPAGWAGWLEDETLVCRCEEISVGTVRRAVAAGARDGRQVKQLTRTGMGWCQGRMCGYAAECLARSGATSGPGLADTASRPVAVPDAAHPVPPIERLVATPVPLGSLGG